ncbi:hypothetical protein PHYPSEUDO_003393 [Phytophthora pseudosyringae]|uniref:Membrane-associated protein n=1 Tax=Phytophthora pseudosyringae TaxID=221518 RepID=A0A8T1VVY7_9STRA|nr:hypothetical protein PHYPSEUDO_003393 [Phytophthora pseudosyringae]
MQRAWPTLVFLVLCVIISIVAATPLSNSAVNTGTATAQASSTIVNMDPSDIVNRQFGAVPPVTSTSSPRDIVDWLVTMDEIFTRVATGGLTSLPPNGFAAIKTMETEITANPNLLNNGGVLKRLLHVLPSLWDIGFWYSPVSEWKEHFGCVFSQAVSAAKLAEDATCYDAAVNATSLMIRFTKDQVFLDGEDHGDSVELRGQNKDYLAYLPELVKALSKKEHFTLTEAQFRAFMATKIPSKTEGMNTAVAFPVYVDTSIYQASDAAALAKFVC